MLTATQAKGGGLDLLAPGLDDLGVVCGSIPYDAVTSLHPNLPPPDPPFELQGEAIPLWSLSPAALGTYAQYVTAKDFVAETPPTETESWNEVLLLVGEMDESWLPLMQALREAGLPAPHPDTVFRELTERGAVSPYLAVCMWPVASGLLAVVDAATPERDFEQTLVRINPTEPAESVVELLQRTLGNPAGVPA